MSAQDWYKLQEIAPGITAIGEPRYAQQNYSYLLLGDEAAGTGPLHQVSASASTSGLSSSKAE